MKTERDNNTTTVIVETSYTGHRSAHLKYLMKYINSQEMMYGKFIFVLNEHIKDLLGELVNSFNYKIQFLDFNKKHKNSIKRSFWEWNLISEQIAAQANITEIIFMDIDIYLVLLVTNRFKKFNLTVKGTLFQPYLHFTGIKRGAAFYFKNVVKNYIFQKYSVFLNSKIRKLFILNDKKTTEKLNKRIKKVFYDLPDPIEINSIDIDPASFEKIEEKYPIKSDKKKLLVFGSIDERKNIINIIDALLLLPAAVKNNIYLIIAGKFTKGIKEKYTEYIEKCKSQISIVYNDGFVTDEERDMLFLSSDLVLIPYINFYSASGVLGLAIVNNKNMVAPNEGLLSRIVNENNLGITVDPLKPAEIKEAVSQLLENPEKFKYDSKKLIEEYSAVNFSKIILN